MTLFKKNIKVEAFEELEPEVSAKKIIKEAAPKIVKKYYDVKVEANIPCLLEYRVFAESPEKAVELAMKSNPIRLKHFIARKKNIKSTVYDMGTSIIRFIKKM